MAETSSPSSFQGLSLSVDPTHHLPLSFLNSDTVPPAPIRSRSTIDWLPDFAGYSWVAYGASSLLVISHLPSPFSSNEILIGPILRHVFQLSGDSSSVVTAVSWSPATPSIGELAAASNNSIYVFLHDSATSNGSFCWSQNAVLVQSTKVEAIAWTGSGDGIVSGGIDVVLWKRRNKSWEIAWKFKTDQPQNLVSATWSVEGPAATAAFWNKSQTKESNNTNTSNFVLVCYGKGLSEYMKAELRHPQPVTMVQWRPSKRSSFSELTHSSNHVLLTCCLDGTVRLWTEVDNGKVRKSVKDNNDQKTVRRFFSVAAVIEINQALNGTLGVDVFLTWVSETSGICKTGEGSSRFFSTEGHDLVRVGRCEWLIGCGPGTSISFWAIHCLDDASPMRFPRVTLWKRQELQELEVAHPGRAGFSNSMDWLLLNKVVIVRNSLSGPPDACSFVHVLPCNSLVWTSLHYQSSTNKEESSLYKCKVNNYLSCSAGAVLSSGHTVKILQVAILPHIYDVELVASLDASGMLLFWSVSAISSHCLTMPTLVPSWKSCGELLTNESCSKYTSLRWAPFTLVDDPVLLMGHAEGIDCFVVKILQSVEEHVVCHKICTIPPTDGPYEDGPTNIFAIPLPPTCNETFQHNRFLLLGVWAQGFCALSWEVILHSCEPSGSCCDSFDEKSTPLYCEWNFRNTFANKRYCICVNSCSSQFPQPHSSEQIASFSVVCPGNFIPMQQNLGFDKNLCNGFPAYVMATGNSNGCVKLWRSTSTKQSRPQIPWELVGNFVAHQGPVKAICLTDYGQKIATISTGSCAENINVLHIWETVHLIGAGVFLLEDRLSFEREIVALNWLDLGNGLLFLGVCFQDELQVYAQKHSDGETLLNCGKFLNLHIWSCISVARALPSISDFLWGPKGMPVIIHDSYLGLFGQPVLVNHKQQAKCQPSFFKEAYEGGKKDSSFPVLPDLDIGIRNLEKPSGKISSTEHSSRHQSDTKEKNYPSSSLSVGRAQYAHGSCGILGSWSLVELAEKLQKTLPAYHPNALLLNIYLGNWKRALASLSHLIEYLTCASEQRCNCTRCNHIIPQMLLSSYFEGLILKDSDDKGFQWNANVRLPTSSSQFFAYDTKFDTFMASSSSMKSDLSCYVEPLEKFYELAALTKKDKLQLLAIIDLLGEIQHSSSAYETLDEPGRRFWVGLRFQQLNFLRTFGRLPSMDEFVADSRLMCWAFHSDCQEILLNSFLPSEPSWKEMQNLGVGFWFTNVAQLRTRMEKLARAQYLKKKDPKDCALLYIALNRLQVLAGLFKISRDERDKPLVGFLSRNFQEEKNKAAALKNAYVLMGRHQLELAVAFFLLGGDTQSAMTICAKNLQDEQLALVICRLVEGRGGPLGRQIITKSILPSASERGDYWLVSVLEWELGNYSKSFLSMLGSMAISSTDKPALSSNHVAFTDPHVGLYCLSLANKNSMRNAIGEQTAAVHGRWATFMAATAFGRCGLPLEALECLSSSSSILGNVDQGSLSDIDPWPFLCEIVRQPLASDSTLWLSGDVSLCLESKMKLDLALQHFSKLVMEHPHWHNNVVCSLQARRRSKDCEFHQYKTMLKNFQEKLSIGLSKLEQKFLVVSSSVVKMILVWLWNNGLSFIGYDILVDYTSRDHSLDKSDAVGSFTLYPIFYKPLLNSTEDISLLLSHFITSCCIACFDPKSWNFENDMSGEVVPTCSDFQGYSLWIILSILQSLKSSIGVYSGPSEDLAKNSFLILDLFEYLVHFASAWLQRNSKVLLLMMQPLSITTTKGHSPYEVDMENMRDILHHVEEILACTSLKNEPEAGHEGISLPQKPNGESLLTFSENEKWFVLGACLWQHMVRFMKNKLHSLPIKLENSSFSGVSHGKDSSWTSRSKTFGSHCESLEENIKLFTLILADIMNTTLLHVSSYHVKLLGSFLQLKIENRLHVPTLSWLEESGSSQANSLHQTVDVDVMDSKDDKSSFDRLWHTYAHPGIISEGFEQEKINGLRFFKKTSCKVWSDVCKDTIKEHETEEICNHEVKPGGSPSREEVGSPAKSIFHNNRTFLNSWQKGIDITKEVSHFRRAKELYKRDGELLEALCINSVNEKQVAVASNRKGISFFSWEDGMPFKDLSNYIWSDADWPLNGWAAAESTPVPTCVTPGVGLGAHLGLGGATVGVGLFERPRRDLTGGGAFGIPGYAGIGASGLGWEVQEDVEEFVDPPATTENISTRAFSSHPSRPLFLVGSSNTHVYLWEFGKDKAIATYGVLPAANVPPPYALASISALQFDHYGHRFATAALDGTVCTWHLEVGGRSNVRPTESSLCFNGHASDISYIASSGSVIAAAGFSSNGVNVVIWDTLAPPMTSRASTVCHEGGTRSISVFDNDIGSGSISPLFVTGGKSGDVGLHDFRYIATGRTKRNRHFENGDASSNASSNSDMQTAASNKLGDHNSNGMLWYIQKAHLGSVTNISTIPQTSLFLTGSKDGDVKLWDAKTARLVCHWPKLHERRTFLQPSSRGFGGVARVGVTDIQVVSHGFLTCGGDGSVKLVQFKDFQHTT